MSSDQDESEVNISSNDQLIKILETLGELSSSDIGFLDDKSSLYVTNLNNQTK